MQFSLSTDTPKVSVLICTNVFDEYLDLSLNSIENQSLSEIEIIVIANNISDESFIKILERSSDPRYIIIRTFVNSLSFSRNLALHICRAPFAAIMDADDISYPSRLHIQLEFLISNPDISICGSNYDLIDKNNNIIRSKLLPFSNSKIRKKMVWSNPICHPSVMFNTSVILKIGGYSNDGAEDYDLWIRLYNSKEIKFENLSVSLLGYRVPVVSQFRRSKLVYFHVASIQFRQFFRTKNIFWLISSAVSFLKVFLIGK